MDIILAIFRDVLYRFWLFVRYRDRNIRRQLWEKFNDANELHWTFWIVPGIIGFALIVLLIAFIFVVLLRP